MNCPICNVSLTMAERQGVEIDYCPQCRGIWLDRGELDKIIERSEQQSAAKTSAPPVDQTCRDRDYKHHGDHHDNKHGHYDQHRKKSLLRELFD